MEFPMICTYRNTYQGENIPLTKFRRTQSFMENSIKYDGDSAVWYGYIWAHKFHKTLMGRPTILRTLHSFLTVLSEKILSPSKFRHEKDSTKFSRWNCLAESVGANILIFCSYTYEHLCNLSFLLPVKIQIRRVETFWLHLYLKHRLKKKIVSIFAAKLSEK